MADLGFCCNGSKQGSKTAFLRCKIVYDGSRSIAALHTLNKLHIIALPRFSTWLNHRRIKSTPVYTLQKTFSNWYRNKIELFWTRITQWMPKGCLSLLYAMSKVASEAAMDWHCWERMQGLLSAFNHQHTASIYAFIQKNYWLYELKNSHCKYLLSQCNSDAFERSFVNWCIFNLYFCLFVWNCYYC